MGSRWPAQATLMRRRPHLLGVGARGYTSPGNLVPGCEPVARLVLPARASIVDTLALGHHGHEPQPAPAAGTCQNVDRKRPLHKLRPAPIATPLAARPGSSSAAGPSLGTRFGSGTIRERRLLAAARTPAYRTVWKRGGGTAAQRRVRSDSGSRSTATCRRRSAFSARCARAPRGLE